MVSVRPAAIGSRRNGAHVKSCGVRLKLLILRSSQPPCDKDG
jgi:hypothetical protein